MRKRENAKDLARELFLHTKFSQKDIAEKVGVSEQTLCKWKEEQEWELLKSATTLTPEKIVSKLYKELNDKLEAGLIPADDLAKYAASIDRLKPNKLTASSYINVMAEFARFVTEIDLEDAKRINKYQQLFIDRIIAQYK